MADNVQHIYGSIEAVRKGDKGDPFTYDDFTPEQLEALKGQDGFSPLVMASSIAGGHKLSIQDAEGVTEFNVMDGQDATSPSIEVSNITGGHRVTIISYNPASVQVVDVMDGQDGQDGDPGQDGVSPTISSAAITGGHRLTIVDADGTTTVDVMDGEDGAPGQDGADGVGIPSGGATGQYLRKKSGADYDTEWDTLPTEVFWATYGTTTNAQLKTAYDAGKLLCVVYDGKVYTLASYLSQTSNFTFSATVGNVYNNYIYYVACSSSSTWTNSYIRLPDPSDSTPKPLGTASAGTYAAYARYDHVHAMPSASDVGAVASSDVEYKVYNSVTDIGLTSGSATIAGAYAAMPAYSVMIANTGDFSNSELPDSVYGTVVIIKVLGGGARGAITLYGKLQSHGDYRKYITSDSTPVPETSWVRIPGAVADGTVTKVFEGTFSNDSTTVQCNGNMALLNLNVRYSTGFSTEGWTDLYTVSPAPINTVYFSMDFQGKSATVRILSASDASKPGYVQILAHTVAYTSYARYVIPYFY